MTSMLDFTKKVFVRSENQIPQDAKVIFVSDMFASDYEGGAELTTEALLETSPYKVFRVKSSDVTADLINNNTQRYWIFGNFSRMEPKLLPLAAQRLRYSVLEYDYKFCRYRSVEKHASTEGKQCDCSSAPVGTTVSAFLSNSKHVFWMSQAQSERYFTHFPQLRSASKHIVLSSVFSKKHLAKMADLHGKYASRKSDKWVVLGSNSWIKGFEDAQSWCKDTGYDTDVLWNVPYDQALERLAQAEGFAYLPRGGDTCPRMVIEAKLLGCRLHTNEHVQNASEKWFVTDELADIQEYLENSPKRFWDEIRSIVEYKATLSGYTQTRNCIEQEYPWQESIGSMLGFCDEVVVVDGGSTDGTWERLQEMAKLNKRIKTFQHVRDWNDKRFALFNGQQKAVARERCTSDFLWQVDIDEVVHESDYDKIKQMVENFPKEVDLVALPVIEYWGDEKKVRVDVNPWKWRLSRNNPRITHGVPKEQRLYDQDGTMYSAGSDGDDYIFKDTLERVPFATFYGNDVDSARQAALAGNPDAIKGYNQWFNSVCVNVPGVYHYSWYDLERKVHTYKNFWSKHWASLYNKVQDDTAENNKFFDKPWSQVTDAEIKSIARKMKDMMGGWIFHTRIDFSKPTPWVELTKAQPACMKSWCERVANKMKGG